jgi:lysophospholipase L1-like esterase
MEATDPQTPEPDPGGESEPGAHPAGVRWVLQLLAALAVVAALPYVLPIPGIEQLRPWRPGTKAPFTGLFEFNPPTRSKIAGVSRSKEQNETDKKLFKAAGLPEGEKSEPERVGAGYRAPSMDQGSNEELRIPSEAYEGMTRSIVDPTDEMHAFYERLKTVARDKEGTLARIFLTSDSVNGADRVSMSLRNRFGERFGRGGKGWVPISPGWSFQRHQDVEWSQDKRWDTWVVNRGNGPLDRYGYGGVLAMNISPGASAFFGTVDEGPGSKVSLFQLYYQAWPGGDDVELRVDGGETTTLSTQAEEVEDRVHELDVEDGPHELEVEVPKPKGARLYGVVMERDGPGVVVDGLGLIGAFTRVLLKWNEDHWQNQLQLRNPNLMIFWLGGNDSISDDVPFIHDEFLKDYGGILTRAKEALPDSSCLVMAPMDAAEERNGNVRTLSQVPRVVEATKEVAEQNDCAFFNTFEAVGGRGTMWRWYHASPRLAESDFRHMTRPGAKVVGGLLYKALLKDYDQYLAQSAD